MKDWCENKGNSMAGNVKSGIGTGVLVDKQESWVIEVLLPGVFTLVLLGCLVHLGYSAAQAQARYASGTQYAISAFPN